MLVHGITQLRTGILWIRRGQRQIDKIHPAISWRDQNSCFPKCC
jgi:hypothetical protein